MNDNNVEIAKENVTEAERAVENTVEINEKMFTQKELNDIISKRLAKQKEIISRELSSELKAREDAVTLRETRANCKEYLLEKGYSVRLLDVIDASDYEQFVNKVKIIQTLQPTEVAPLATLGTVSTKNEEDPFKQKTNHNPKGYWATDKR